MSRKERAEKGIEVCPVNLSAIVFLCLILLPEGLSLVHSQNRRGLCLLSDELSAWVKNFNRYNNGSEEQFWLSVFSAKAHHVRPQKLAQLNLHQASVCIRYRHDAKKRILSELAKGVNAPPTVSLTAFCLFCSATKNPTRWSMKQPTFDVAAEWQRILSDLWNWNALLMRTTTSYLRLFRSRMKP